MATLAVVISTVGLVVAGISAIGTVAYAFITQAARTEAKSAAASAAASAEATKASAEATKRLADYAEAELAVLRQQLEEERERNRPTVQTKVLMGHVAQRGPPEVLAMIRFVTTNIGRAADVLTGIEVRFGRQPDSSPDEHFDGSLYTAAGHTMQAVRPPLGLAPGQPVELRFEFKVPEMTAEPGRSYPAVLTLTFEHASPFTADVAVVCGT
jgi:hypothetical protein